ncbi:ABC transporter ATP-binding protein [Oceanobacillus piezotolerans]|uniref:ABC transporter ATP-binding protein n=1 Tax=Oceanobacillus piezotolerans TaxID=2448030 RepID=A0A498DGS5_9BACI|nr:ABC transporter ATP-binding protein [Oceanobacillus piezotolerans]RLL47141.1 ABC transporter ATP-binding protein [Oceanobacillus piezotolerans]
MLQYREKEVLELQKVSWKRDGIRILSDINWQVNKGEHWAILGLNGSGKTTLLNLINGYLWPTTGNISVLNQPFGKTDLRLLRKSIGWVSSSLQERIKETSLVEDVVLSGKYASIGLYDTPDKTDIEQAETLMEQLGFSHLKGRSYRTCSQGEKQKILIARGLMANPLLLILDEPTTGLDFLAREDLLMSIEKMAEAEHAPTILFVTHHMEEILPIFSHTLMLRDGQVFAEGETRSVITENKLSTFFSIPVSIEWREGRAWMTRK